MKTRQSADKICSASPPLLLSLPNWRSCEHGWRYSLRRQIWETEINSLLSHMHVSPGGLFLQLVFVLIIAPGAPLDGRFYKVREQEEEWTPNVPRVLQTWSCLNEKLGKGQLKHRVQPKCVPGYPSWDPIFDPVKKKWTYSLLEAMALG